jgi:hypothetical protein
MPELAIERNASGSANPLLSHPIAGICCWARATSGHAIDPPTSAINSRRFTASLEPPHSRKSGSGYQMILHRGALALVRRNERMSATSARVQFASVQVS